MRSLLLYLPMPAWRRAAAVVLLASIAGVAGAEDSSPLSLAEAVRLAETQAPSLDARQAAVAAATDAIGPAGELPDPELVAGIDNLPVSTDAAFSVSRDFMTMRKIGVMQTFIRRDTRDSRSRRAQAVAEGERARLVNARLDVREAAARAWIARWTAERRLTLLASLRARADAQVDAARAALTSGRGSAAEGIAAQSARALLEDRISQAQRDVDGARAEFARWLPGQAGRALGEAPAWGDLGRDPDAILQHVGVHREMLTYDAAENVAQAELALARAQKRPDWTVEFDVAHRSPPFSNMVSLQVRIPLPLFAARRQDPLVASKLAAAEQVAAERQDALRMHEADLRKTLATWQRALERAQRYERTILPLADARADASLAAYRGGGGDLQGALAALDDAVEQRIAYTGLLSELGQAWAELHFAFLQEP
jgi:outer membrane protein TolC